MQTVHVFLIISMSAPDIMNLQYEAKPNLKRIPNHTDAAKRVYSKGKFLVITY